MAVTKEPLKGPSGVRIVGINTDKTRRSAGSDDLYHIYFTLSESPTQEWRATFLDEWKKLNPNPALAWPAAGIESGFVFVDCPLKDVQTTFLPALKKAVAATNAKHDVHIREEASAQERRENVWKDERTAVEEMASQLKFD